MAERCNRCGYTVANVNCPDCAPVYREARPKAPPSLPGRDELNDWFLSLPDARQKALLDGDRWVLAGAAFLAGQQSERPAPAGQAVGIVELAKMHRTWKTESGGHIFNDQTIQYFAEAVIRRHFERPVGEVDNEGCINWFDKSPGDWEPGTKLYLASQAERPAVKERNPSPKGMSDE